MMETNQPVGSFIPSRHNDERMAWWSLSRGCLTQMLDLLGFAVQGSIESKPLCLVKGRQQPEPCTSLVARRVAGSTCLTGSRRNPDWRREAGIISGTPRMGGISRSMIAGCTVTTDARASK